MDKIFKEEKPQTTEYNSFYDRVLSTIIQEIHSIQDENNSEFRFEFKDEKKYKTILYCAIILHNFTKFEVRVNCKFLTFLKLRKKYKWIRFARRHDLTSYQDIFDKTKKLNDSVSEDTFEKIYDEFDLEV